MDIYDFQTERLSYNFDPDAVDAPDAPDASFVLKSPTMPPPDQHSPTPPPPIQHSPTPPPPVLRTPILSEPILPSQGVPLQEPDQPTLHPHTGVPLFPVVFEEMFGKRKRGAECWKEFKFYKDKDGLLYAICVHCRGVAYRAESSFGTSNPTRHILNCEKFKKKSPSVDGNKSKDFDQSVYVELMAEAIMMHGYPFSIVEHAGLRRVHSYLNENVKTVSRNTIKKVCILKHVQFKEKIKNILGALSSRVCLTSDVWTACTSRAYLTLTVHYVDDKWTLRSKVLNFVHFPPPHTGLEIYNTLYNLIKEWGIEKKVFSMTLDNATNMDSMITQLKSSLVDNLPLSGRFFHIRCCAHILNLVVQSGMSKIAECVSKVRKNVKHIDASEARLIKFYACAQQCFLPCNTKLWLDVETRWNSTYLMLKKAIYYREAMDLYGTFDMKFPHSLTPAEWSKAEKVCSLLEPFYEITTLFSGSEYPTANLYFFNIWKIDKLLRAEVNSADVVISDIAKEMTIKFEKYWVRYSLILSFGVILDPRFKLDFVKFAIKKLHGETVGTTMASVVEANFVELFTDYEKRLPVGTEYGSSSTRAPASNSELEEFDACFGGSTRTGKTEYEQYFADDKEPRSENLDILKYWAERSKTYPTLYWMAKDILAIPITTVASESTFSMGGRILNKWRSSLLSRNVEALVTTRNWLFGYEEMEEEGVEVGSKSDDED